MFGRFHVMFGRFHVMFGSFHVMFGLDPNIARRHTLALHINYDARAN
jgi:hypothetical protein